MKRLFVHSILFIGIMLSFIPKIVAQGSKSPDIQYKPSLAYDPFSSYPVYTGSDLGVTYSPESTRIKVWSPAAEEMRVKIYKTSTGDDLMYESVFQKMADGIWSIELPGDRKNQYYTIQAKFKGNWNEECPDPYAKAVGVNGKRGQILEFNETNPSGWAQDKAPLLKNLNDVVLYELHVRDLSIAPNSGIRNKGKFLAFTEFGTENPHQQSTGIDHIAELGVTHVHLLPAFDFCSVDESKLNVPQYNWGYDPQNYNAPDGSYSTNPEDGKVRILEFKEMVLSMHKKGLRVVMDVVYNHTGFTHNSNFDLIVPGYYYRQWEKDNSYSNASGCGNETASDRAMVRKYIVESVCYWVKEYHVDGFRFDLMAIHDIETMNEVATALHTIDPTIIIYGEGWTAGDSPLPEKYRALKKNAKMMNGVAVFSDDIRDAVKGSVFDDKSIGFASGATNMVESIKFGIVAAGEHPQIDYNKVNYSKEPYTKEPTEVINYVSCHDNNTLYDKLKISRPDASEVEIVRMHKLANSIVLTSQGIPFLHAGVEMKRTKKGDHNSFNKPDSINQIDWDWKFYNKDLFVYYRKLIELRKNHPAFRMSSSKMIQEKLEFFPQIDAQVVAYKLKDHANGDPWREILVVFNGANVSKNLELPSGGWKVALKDGKFVSIEQEMRGTIVVEPISTCILYQP